MTRTSPGPSPVCGAEERKITIREILGRIGNPGAPEALEFTHFLSDEVRLTPINKGWNAFSYL